MHCLVYDPTGQATAGGKIPDSARTLSCTDRHQQGLILLVTVLALTQVILDQRHRRCSIRSGELYLRETVHLLEALVTTDLTLARFGYGSHQFVEVTSIQHRNSPVPLLMS